MAALTSVSATACACLVPDMTSARARMNGELVCELVCVDAIDAIDASVRPPRVLRKSLYTICHTSKVTPHTSLTQVTYSKSHPTQALHKSHSAQALHKSHMPSHIFQVTYSKSHMPSHIPHKSHMPSHIPHKSLHVTPDPQLYF